MFLDDLIRYEDELNMDVHEATIKKLQIQRKMKKWITKIFKNI